MSEGQISKWRDMSVLVTGAAGFLGSHLSERLYQAGSKLLLVDDYSNASFPKGREIAGQRVLNRTVHSASLTDLIVKYHPEVIFHLAGNAQVPRSVLDPEKDMRSNLEGTFCLLETLRSLDFSGIFLFVSSAAIYGEPRYLPVDENHPAHPISPYGVSKLAAENYVSIYANLYGLKTVSIRPFSIYGPRQKKQVVYDLIKKAGTSDSQWLIGDGNEVRDLVYVSDAVEALIKIVESGSHDGSAYNLCSGVGITIRQLAEELSSLLNSQISFQFSGERRPGDPVCWIGSPEKINNLGFVSQISLRDGLRNTIEWFRGTT